MPNRILRDFTDSYRFEHLNADVERLFVRLIMKVDDFGRYHADPRLIRSGCFPLLTNLRDSDISRWLGDLVKAGLIVVYEVQGRSYLAIVNFGQRAPRIASSKFPSRGGEASDWQPLDGQMTVKCQSNDGLDGGVDEDEGGGVDGEKPPTPLTLLISAWDAIGLSKVVKVTDSRRKAADARLADQFWREHYAEGLARMAKSSFCRGSNNRGWKADFDWFVKPDTLPKMLEGKYDDKPKATLHPVTGKPMRGPAE